MIVVLVGAPGGVKDREAAPARRPNRYRARVEAPVRRLGTCYAAHRTAVRRVAVRTVAGTAVAGLALGWLLWGSDVTRVDEVAVTILDPRAPSSGRLLTDETVRSRTAQIGNQVELLLDEPLVEVDTSAVSRRVGDLKRYSKVTVERGWPSRVDITVTPRMAVLAVVDATSGVQLLDGAGVAFERVAHTPPGVPTATLSGGGPVSARAAVAALLALSGPGRERVRQLAVDSEGHVELQVGSVRVTWGGQGDERLKAAVVHALVGSPGIDHIDVSTPQRPVTTTGDRPAAKPVP